MSAQTLKPDREVVKFGEVVKNENLVERDPKNNDIKRIVGLEHIDPENLHIRRWNLPEDGTSFTRKFVPGQTLFGKRRAYQRKVAYAEFEGICSGDILTFEPTDKQVLLPEFLPFICQSDAFFEYALGTSAGSLSPRTNWKSLKDFEISLPSLDDQKRIAEILWAVDEVAETAEDLLSRLITTYEVTAMNLYKGKESVEQRYKTKLWDVPKSWSVKPLEAVSAKDSPIRYGIVQVGKDTEGGVPTLAIKNLKGNFLDGIHRTNKKKEAQYRNSRVQSGDVLLSIKATIGEVAEVPEGFIGNISRDLARIRLGKEVLPGFLVHLFKTKLYQRYLNKYVVGSTRKEMSIHALRKLLIPVPTIEQQKRILNQLIEIENRISEVKCSITNSRHLLKSLLNTLPLIESLEVKSV